MTEVRQDSHQDTDRGVGEKKAGGKTRGCRQGQTLEPRTDGGKEAKAGSGNQRPVVEFHGLILPVPQGIPKEKSLRGFLNLPPGEE